MTTHKPPTVQSVLTKNVVTIHIEESLTEAQTLMKEKRIRHLPVVDSNDLVVGVISQRDITNIEDPEELTVGLLMSSPVDAIDENTDLRTATLRMLEKKISCLLVTDLKLNLVGIVTTDDLLWCLAHQLKEESDKNKSFIGALGLQIIGDVANKLSIMGI